MIPIAKAKEIADVSEMNIYQKMALIGEVVDVMKKNKAGHGYMYTTEESILARIKGKMADYHISLIPEIVPGTLKVSPFLTKKTKVTESGSIYEQNVNEVLVSSDMYFHWVNNDNPEERIVVPWALVGHQADASQAFGSGLTYVTRYFLLRYFGIATANDPDEIRSQQQQVAEEEAQRLCADLIDHFNLTLRSYVASHPDKKDEVQKFCAAYVKDGNYRKIKDPELAAKLIGDFNNRFHQ